MLPELDDFLGFLGAHPLLNFVVIVLLIVLAIIMVKFKQTVIQKLDKIIENIENLKIFKINIFGFNLAKFIIPIIKDNLNDIKEKLALLDDLKKSIGLGQFFKLFRILFFVLAVYLFMSMNGLYGGFGIWWFIIGILALRGMIVYLYLAIQDFFLSRITYMFGKVSLKDILDENTGASDIINNALGEISEFAPDTLKEKISNLFEKLLAFNQKVTIKILKFLLRLLLRNYVPYQDFGSYYKKFGHYYKAPAERLYNYIKNWLKRLFLSILKKLRKLIIFLFVCFIFRFYFFKITDVGQSQPFIVIVIIYIILAFLVFLLDRIIKLVGDLINLFKLLRLLFQKYLYIMLFFILNIVLLFFLENYPFIFQLFVFELILIIIFVIMSIIRIAIHFFELDVKSNTYVYLITVFFTIVLNPMFGGMTNVLVLMIVLSLQDKEAITCTDSMLLGNYQSIIYENIEEDSDENNPIRQLIKIISFKRIIIWIIMLTVVTVVFTYFRVKYWSPYLSLMRSMN